MKGRTRGTAAAIVLPGFALCTSFACAGTGDSDVEGVPAVPTTGSIAVDTIASGLEVPWALAFAPDGRLFVSERPGRIRVVEQGSLLEEPWAELEVGATGEAGLLGIAVAPDFATTGHVYVVGTFRGEETIVNRVLRFTDRDGRGVDPVVIVDDLPAGRFHAGSALAFGPDGMLYVTTGDARRPALAQQRAALAGKVLRYTPDGRVPVDNPRRASPVFAIGVRNSQGIAWHPETGDLFAIDHGPSGFPDERFRRNRDELNAIVADGNYGWAEVAGRGGGARFIDPLVVWTPAIAPGGLAIYTGSHEPWYGDAFVGGLRGAQLRRVDLVPDPDSRNGWRAVSQEVFFDGELGRIRAVSMGPDGHLYLSTSNRDGRASPGAADDLIVRLRPSR